MFCACREWRRSTCCLTTPSRDRLFFFSSFFFLRITLFFCRSSPFSFLGVCFFLFLWRDVVDREKSTFYVSILFLALYHFLLQIIFTSLLVIFLQVLCLLKVRQLAAITIQKVYRGKTNTSFEGTRRRYFIHLLKYTPI